MGAKEKIEAIFGDLTPLLGDLDEVYSSMVKPLILELAKAVNAIYEAAKRLKLPLDATESVADESIDPARCSWRQTRWFKSIEDYNVDIEKTMVCDSVKTFGASRHERMETVHRRNVMGLFCRVTTAFFMS